MHVIVIGGGIAGLAAAHRLLEGGARVTVLESSPRLGGKLYAGRIADVAVDLGAESMLARRPEGLDLARAAGLGDALQPPATGTAAIWTRGEVRPLPTGHLMGVPADPAVLGGVLSPDGLARAAEDAELPRTEVGEDVAVGEYVAARLGREVVDRLVEPLLGGVYAGDAYRISLRASVPALFEAARKERSLLAAVRGVQERAAARRQDGPVFMGIEGGMGRLPGAVADTCRAAGAEILTGTPAEELRRTGKGWTVTAGGRAREADAVVLAVPAPAAARLLAGPAPSAAAELSGVEYASMALVTMAFRRSDLASVPEGRGFLVPAVDGRTIKASTFSTNKWHWNAAQDPGLFVLRTSLGRYGEEEVLGLDDADLVEASLRDLGTAIGLTARPVASTVTRWNDGLPQYPVGHLERVARVRRHLAALPGLAVCGAAYDGVGIPACVGGARAAAGAVLAGGAPAGTPAGVEDPATGRPGRRARMNP
jgi:oxygen-dependent protoporphyrinogen oxidase